MTQQFPLPPDNASTKCMPAELLANPLFLLGRLGVVVKSRAFEEFELAGFSPYHYSVLALLEEGERPTQAEIADALELDRGTLVRLLDVLEERGMIERQRDPNDRRRHVVRLTDAGRTQLTAFREIIIRLDGEFLEPLSADERLALLDLLTRLARHLGPPFIPAGALPAATGV
jgi:MarR family transcriptional regulator, lower aerobic nicotinate degradation pathway regulator